MNNKIWVLTYTIGTNEGRKQRRLTCDTKEQAEMQRQVLGGEVREYAEVPHTFKVRWPADLSAEEVREAMRLAASDDTFRDQYMCQPVSTVEPINIEVVLSEVSALIDDLSTAAPGSFGSLYAGSEFWNRQKACVINNFEDMLLRMKI